MPEGYRHDRWEADLGAFDNERFARSAAALRRWDVQRGAGLRIFPGDPVRPDLTFALVIRLPVGYATAAGRVVYVVDEPERYGFAYGTLPAHPEQGEEAFQVARDGDRLIFTIIAFSRPRHPAARLGAPVSRALQLRVTRCYLNAMRRGTARSAVAARRLSRPVPGAGGATGPRVRERSSWLRAIGPPERPRDHCPPEVNSAPRTNRARGQDLSAGGRNGSAREPHRCPAPTNVRKGGLTREKVA